MDFSVVIPTLGRTDDLRRALGSLTACCPPPGEIIIVDGDPARSAEAIVHETAAPPVRIRYIPSDMGLTRQRNRGLAACRGDVVAFFDDDVAVMPDIFARLSDAYQELSIVGVTGRVIEPDDQRVGGSRSPIRWLLLGGGRHGGFTRYGFPRRLARTDRAQNVQFMQGCFMTARLPAARSVAFDEELTGYGLAEDEDFSYRLSAYGRIRYLPDAVVHHANTGFRTRDARAFGRTVVANRTYLFHKNFPQTLLARGQFGLLLLALVAHRVVNRDWAGARGLVEGISSVFAGRTSHGVTAAAAVPVVFVSSQGGLGGSERYLVRLLDRLDPAWIGPVVVLGEGPLIERLEATGLDLVVLPTSNRRLSMLASAWQLRRVVGRHGPVVHANGVKAALVSVLATTGRRTRVVWIKHDFSWDGPVARLIAWRCKLVVGVSRAVVASLPAKRVRVVPTGLASVAVDRVGSRHRLGEVLGQAWPIIMLVGRLHPVKGHADAVAATSTLVGHWPNLRLAFVGPADESQPHYRRSIERLIADADMASHVAWVGPREDARTLIAGADIVVVPTVKDDRGMGAEGFGLVALEAMACGTPVVGYAHGALPEVVGDCALLVPPNDRMALGRAIERILRDRNLNLALSERGRARAAELFVEDAWVSGLRAAYREAAGRRAIIDP